MPSDTACIARTSAIKCPMPSTPDDATGETRSPLARPAPLPDLLMLLPRLPVRAPAARGDPRAPLDFRLSSVMGTKTILNELLAFLEMAKLPAEALDPRSRLIMTYALASFANFGSLGILIGGLGSLAPDRRDEVVGLGMKALVAGTLATCMTGAVIGIFS